jgi:transposase, IS5 family
MRRLHLQQLVLSAAPNEEEHVGARELAEIDRALRQLPDDEILTMVHADLTGPDVSADKGREGMTADLVLRALIIKQLYGLTYRGLAYCLADSNGCRAFCRIGPGDESPKRSALQSNIKLLKPETLEAINTKLLDLARQRGVERGRKTRTDCTVIETNIHEPSDSSLLFDCVNVLVRLMTEARKLRSTIEFTDHSKRAKRRMLNIQYAKRKLSRVEWYKDLIKVTKKTVRWAEAALKQLDDATASDDAALGRLQASQELLRHYIPLAHQVLSQTERRVLRGEKVKAGDKIVSIFEPHTDIIVKDNRDTYYGHKVCLTAGASNLVLDLVVQEGNPPDSKLTAFMMQRQEQIYGRPPRQAVFDGSFASRANLETLKELGVDDAVFSKGRGLSVTEMASSTRVYQRLRNFRAGVESVISSLKRVFGWDRCTWRGFESFKAYAWASVLSHNLLVMARQAIAGG